MTMSCLRAAALLLAGALAAAAETASYPDDSDHTIYVQVRSDPPGVQLLAPPTEPGEKPTLVGVAPHVVVLELKWDRPLIRKDWRRLAVWSPGSIGQASFDEKEQRHDVFLNFVAALPGYRSERINTRVASFFKEGFDWEKADRTPTKTVINVVLTPTSSTAEVSAALPPPTGARPPVLRTVMIASGKGGAKETGTLVVSANVAGADVWVDGQKAGETPLRLIIAAGPHSVEVRERGYQAVTEKVAVASQVEGDLKVNLVKSAP